MKQEMGILQVPKEESRKIYDYRIDGDDKKPVRSSYKVSDIDDNANTSVQLIHEKTTMQQESNHPNTPCTQ